MSIEAINWVLKQKLEKSSCKFVLLMIANCADQDGVGWPSAAYISEATCLNIKTVEKAIKYLKDENWIIDTGQKSGKTKQVIKYKINFNRGLQPVDNSGSINTPKIGGVKKQKENQNVKKHPQNRASINTTPKSTNKHPQNRGTDTSIDTIYKHRETVDNFPVDNLKNRPQKKYQKPKLTLAYINQHARRGETYEQARERLSDEINKNYQEYPQFSVM